MQFGAKPLFENISVKFGEGNRYGLIGANGCGKSTFMKIQFRTYNNHRTSGIIHTFTKQVLTETSLFSFKTVA